MTFDNLADGGRQLASAVEQAMAGDACLVLAAIPNGVPVALPVASALGVRAHALPVDRSGPSPTVALPEADVDGRTVIVVDDGVETGSVARAAATALKGAGPARLVLAVPVCSRQAMADLAGLYDEIIAIDRPLARRSLAWHFRDFDVIDEATALALLAGQPA
jgi:predicted phosphoribosyltransferase